MVALQLADVAAGQWGMVTTAQAGAVGVTSQAVAKLALNGVLERLAYGVYRLAGTPSGPFDDLRAAWLAIDPGRTVADRHRDHPPDVVSHRSAARLLGLGDLDADRHEFTTARRRQSRRLDVRFHRGDVAEGEWTLVDGLPVTSAARTIADLAAAGTDGGHLAGVVRDALLSELIEADALAEVLRPHAHRYGAPLGDGKGLLARFLAEAGVPESTIQTAELVSPTLVIDTTALQALAAKMTPDLQRTMRAVIEESGVARRAMEPFTSNPEFQRFVQRLSAQQLEQFQRVIAEAQRLQRRIG